MCQPLRGPDFEGRTLAEVVRGLLILERRDMLASLGVVNDEHDSS